MKTIPLTQNKEMLVDDDDFDELNKYKWYAKKDRSGTWYAYRNSSYKNDKRTSITSHRQIMGFPKNKEIDHINHNGLDNRQSNLRICTRSQNRRNNQGYKNNTSGFNNVTWHVKHQKWQARIYQNGKRIHIGLFDDPEIAAREVDKKAIKLYGEFAVLNFPEGK